METNNEEPLTIELLAEEANGDDGSAVTPLLLFSIFIALSGSYAGGCATGYSSPVESAIMEDLGLTTAQYSLFGSILACGSLVGSLFSGRIADIVSRRGAMGISDVLSLIGWITISVSQEAWSLYIGRFLVGVSMGILVYVVPIYIAEITPYNFRGRLITLTLVMEPVGVLVMFFVGSLISWRILVLIGIIPCLVQLIGILFIPESPRFLAKRGQNVAFMVVLQRLRGDNIDISKEAAEIEEVPDGAQCTVEVGFLGLFKRKYAHTFVVVFGLMILGGLGGPGSILCYASSVFESAGFSSSLGSLILAIVPLPFAITSAYFIDNFGRRPLLMISTGAMSFCCFFVGIMFLMKENNLLENITPYLIVVGLWGYSAAFPIGMAAIPSIIMSEVLSMDVKGSAGSLAIVVSGGSAWVLMYTFNFLTEWSFAGAFFILASINVLTALFVVKLVPETKGRTLEEIQQSFKEQALF